MKVLSETPAWKGGGLLDPGGGFKAVSREAALRG